METNEKPGLMSLDEAHEVWKAMPPAEREELLSQPGGWGGGPRAKSKINSEVRQLAKRKWIEFAELTRYSIRNLMMRYGARPKPRVALCGSSAQSQPMPPVEYAPPVRRVIVNRIGADGLTDAERAAGKEPLA